MRLCEDEGYHCIHEQTTDPEIRRKIIMFWVAFSMDRGLCLNFGKTPSLQDSDVTTYRPTLDELPVTYDDYGLFFSAIGSDLAFLQGDIYQQLFSARAQLESRQDLGVRAVKLAERVIFLQQQLGKVSKTLLGFV